MEQQRAVLDQLFGLERDLPLSQLSKTKKSYADKEVCKYYLAGLCPYHELFKNTKSDLGPCQFQLHDARFKEEYNALSNEHKQRYERELSRKLQDLVREMDRKIAKNKQRADEENAPKSVTEEQQRLLDDMSTQVKQLMELSQKLGEEGNVTESLQTAQEAEKIKTERESMDKLLKYPCGRIMFVCEVCGVFINSTDNEARRADHYNGKQYLGWKAIRDKLRDLETKLTRPVVENQSLGSVRRGKSAESNSGTLRLRRGRQDDCLSRSDLRGRFYRRSHSRKERRRSR
jgi:rubrerythrin